MILIPQTVVRDCLAVFRRALPKPFLAWAATAVRVIAGRDGVKLQLVLPDIAVQYYHASPADAVEFTLPISALVDCEGRGTGVVQVHPARSKIGLHWEQSGVPYHREYDAPKPAAAFPAWPSRDVANDPSFLTALDEAMQIPTGTLGRLALTHIQLRGRQGDIVATDGRQLLIQGGFQFPWSEPLLVSRTPIFASRELPRGEVVRVGQNKTHVFFRISGWSIVLPIETSTRFPNVDAVIPNAVNAVARWHIADDEASALAKLLDNLPAAKEDHAPITLELTRPVAIRARGEDEKRCTDVVLPQSKLEGKAVRMATDRRLLQKALELGFRSVLVTASDKPILCQDGKRTFVWVPLDSKDALKPQSNAIRIVLPAPADAVRRIPGPAERSPSSLPAPVRQSVLAGPTPRSSAPNRILGRFLNGARSLWDLVRKHRRKQHAE